MKATVFGLILLTSSLAWADQFRLLRKDSDALQARVDLIQQAKHEILVEYYSVWNDDQSISGVALLIDAAKRGVKVKILLDALSNTLKKETFAVLLAEGKDANGEQNLEIKLYNPISNGIRNITKRSHAKLLVADGEYIITGGRNVGDKYFGINEKRNFTDLDFYAKGEIAQVARENFLAGWEASHNRKVKLGKFAPDYNFPSCRHQETSSLEDCTERIKVQKKFEKETQRVNKILADIKLYQEGDIVKPDTNFDWFQDSYKIEDKKFVSHDPTRLVSEETAELNKNLMKLLTSAKSEVNVVSPYLVPTDSLMDALRDLRSRNVKIKIITNSLHSTDNLFAQAGYRASKKELIALGVELYEYNGPDTLHAKTGLIDNQVIYIGTYNIDPRSAFLNREIGIIANDATDTGLSKELFTIIEHWRTNSTIVGKDGVPLNQDKEMEGVSKVKRAALKAIRLILPLIRHQI